MGNYLPTDQETTSQVSYVNYGNMDSKDLRSIKEQVDTELTLRESNPDDVKEEELYKAYLAFHKKCAPYQSVSSPWMPISTRDSPMWRYEFIQYFRDKFPNALDGNIDAIKKKLLEDWYPPTDTDCCDGLD